MRKKNGVQKKMLIKHFEWLLKVTHKKSCEKKGSEGDLITGFGAVIVFFFFECIYSTIVSFATIRFSVMMTAHILLLTGSGYLLIYFCACDTSQVVGWWIGGRMCS